VIEQGEREVAEEAAQREQHDPPAERGRVGWLEAQEQEKEAHARVRERGHEGGRIDEVAKRLLREEGALEVEHHAHGPDDDRGDTDQELDHTQDPAAQAENHGHEEPHGRGREHDRCPLDPAREAVRGMGHEDVAAQEGEVGDDEPLETARGRRTRHGLPARRRAAASSISVRNRSSS
jgi:hypothetical protein